MTPSLTEAVARALCVARKPKPADAIDAWALLNHWAEYGSADASREVRQFYAEAGEFIAAIEGFVVVPREPTKEMLSVDGLSPLLRHGAGSNDRVQQWRGCLWEAMIAARPEASA